MRLGALAAVMTVLDELLGVVPGAAARSHGNRQEQAGDDGAEQHRADGGERRRLAVDQIDHRIKDDRRQDRQQRRHDHLLDRGPGQYIDGAAIVGLAGAFHDARDLLELAAHLDDDGGGGAAHGAHAHRSEQVGQRAPEDKADDDERVLQAEGHRQIREVMAQILGISGEQHQRREAGRADGVALGHRLGGVADGIESVGRLADLGRKIGHLGDAPGVVGDRPIGIERHHYTGKRQHGGGGDGDPEQPGIEMGEDDTAADHHRRQGRGLHGNGKALDDIGAMPGRRRLGHGPHRRVIGAGVVFGDPHQEAGDTEPDKPGIEQIPPLERLAGDLEFSAETDP